MSDRAKSVGTDGKLLLIEIPFDIVLIRFYYTTIG